LELCLGQTFTVNTDGYTPAVSRYDSCNGSLEELDLFFHATQSGQLAARFTGHFYIVDKSKHY
jgi:hypothetical protein